jgi:hypothetical protein
MKKCLSAIGMVALAMVVLPMLIGVPTAFAIETRGLSVIVKDPATGQPAGEVKLYGKAYAVLIGIDKYSDPEIPRLKNAVSDAKGIRKVLEQRFKFDQFITLYDEEATQKRIMELFKDELADKVAVDDAVFVFWAGHGTQQENITYGDIGYLIPYDGSWKRQSRNISMETIKTDISKSLKARHVFYGMDACYGGLMTDKRAINPQTNRDLKALQQLAKEDVRQVLTAGSKGEQVLDGIRGHSVFTARLIEALEATGDFITANEIQAIISRNVISDALKLGHNQTPQYGKLYGQGDFVFVPSKEYQFAEKQEEIERIRRATLQTRDESDRMQKQIAADEALLERARKAGDERKQQEINHELQKKQASFKLEEVKRRAQEDQLRQAEQVAAELKKIENERQRIIEEARLQEQRIKVEEGLRQSELQRLEMEQQQKKADEEKKLALLRKQGEENRKKAMEAVSSVLSIEAAVQEIRSADARIAEIIKEYDAEETRLKAGADKRRAEKLELLKQGFDRRMADLKSRPSTLPVAKLVVDPRGEFETKAEYEARVSKTNADYQRRLADASSVGTKAQQAEADAREQGERQAREQHEKELTAISGRIAASREEATQPFRERIATIAGKEYPLSPVAMKLDIGVYNPDEGRFPISITSSSSTVPLDWAGEIQMSRDDAKQFKQHYTAGLVRPEVTMKIGKKRPILLALVDDGVANDAKNYRMVAVDGKFISLQERDRELERVTYTDSRTGLMWAREDNGFNVDWATAKSYCENSIVGITGWRMPTQDELEGLYTSRAYKDKIKLTGWRHWASEKRGDAAAIFSFKEGTRQWYRQSAGTNRVLPVRSVK